MRKKRSTKGRRRQETARGQRNLKFALAMITVLSACFLVFTSFLGDRSLIQLHRMEQARKGWVEENRALKKENALLRAKIKAARRDPFVVEKIAREELGMVRRDEVVYLFHSDRIGDVEGVSSPSPKKDLDPR